LSLLPSVRSLYQLRADLPPSRAREMFLGIGAPDFKGTPEHSTQLSLTSLFATRGVGNRAAIAQLPPLPSAADELRTIAQTLRTSASDLLLGGQATERELRKRPLNDYRVISFATHALVAGEIDGVTEPALALAPGPDARDRNNDGLLTITEVANLALDANLVILSACNTAAPDGAAAGRGLSGLADAFFFAGARALAVTQWAVFSDAARQIGAGLIARSSSQGRGVSEGLRQTMAYYISSAKEDYLAHPRFWAAFIIAGDGAVSPLAQTETIPLPNDPIDVEWQHLRQDDRDTEMIGLARTASATYALGAARPPAGEKRGGSYLVRIHAGKRVELVDYSHDMAASSLVGLGKELGVLGFFPSDHKSSAVFRLFGDDGRQHWQHVEDSELWNFAVSIVKSPTGYILVSIENHSSLVLTSVSEGGTSIAQRRHPIPVANPRSTPKNVAVLNGSLVIAIAGNQPATSGARPAVWTNPQTGSKKLCTPSPATTLFSIDIATLDVQFQRTIENTAVASVRENNERLYAAVAFNPGCGLDRNIRLAEIQAGFELKTIFERKPANTIEVGDFVVTPDRFILVGVFRAFLPTALTRETMGVQAIDPWDDSLLEKVEERTSAFILVLAKDGTVIGDRVFPDTRHRSLSNVVAEASGRFVAVGSALGDRGWVISFDLNGQPGWRQSLEAALRRFWGLLGGAVGRH
jgi:hypothetical protein